MIHHVIFRVLVTPTSSKLNPDWTDAMQTAEAMVFQAIQDDCRPVGRDPEPDHQLVLLHTAKRVPSGQAVWLARPHCAVVQFCELELLEHTLPCSCGASFLQMTPLSPYNHLYLIKMLRQQVCTLTAVHRPHVMHCLA